MISSLAHDEREHMCSGEGNVGTDSIQTLKLVGYEYVSAMCEKIRSLELELCIADVAALDVIEFGVLAAATRAGKPGLSSAQCCDNIICSCLELIFL